MSKYVIELVETKNGYHYVAQCVTHRDKENILIGKSHDLSDAVEHVLRSASGTECKDKVTITFINCI